MKIKFLGAARTVTGSSFLIESEKLRFLIDCGLFQGTKELRELNYGEFDFDPADIDFMILSHAHIDHSGLIPKLVKKGFSGKIYCTGATVELCKLMLPDSGFIQEMEVERKNRKNLRAGKPLLEPIYTESDAKIALEHFVGLEYDQQISPAPGVWISLQNSGHILGSAIIEIWVEENGKKTKVVFTGDIGDFNQPIIQDPVFIKEADYLVIESTYGARVRDKFDDKKMQLLKLIEETKAARGNLIIPAFAVERTQDLLFYLSQLEDEGYLKNLNIFVDSPLAISATEIFCKSEKYFDQATKEMAARNNNCPFSLPGLKFTRTAEESMELNRINSGAIIISASGMCDFGRIKHHLKHNLWRKESTILFVGYQAVGTLGRRILDGEKTVRIHGEEIRIRARIVSIEGFSAHADQYALLNWIKGFIKKPKKIFVVHGEEKNSEELAQLVMQEIGVNAVIPNRLDVVELIGSLAENPLEVAEVKLASLNKELQLLQEKLNVHNELQSLFDRVEEIRQLLRRSKEE